MLQRQLLTSFLAGALTVLLITWLHSSASVPDLLITRAIARSPASQSQQPLGVASSPSRDALPITPFPNLIWQTGSSASIAQYITQTSTWTSLNPNHTHTILTDDAADAYVHTHFAHSASLIHLWETLPKPVLRADLLRYLLMLSHGGVYSDIDTSCLAPISSWIPPEYLVSANAVVGIEYDDSTYKMFVRSVSFSQWTLMAKPGHAIFERAVGRVRANLEVLARVKRVEMKDLVLKKEEVLEATGPGMISDVVLEVLRDQTGKKALDWKDFKRWREPRLVGDVLVLPINGFASGQKHSHSGQEGWGRTLVKHHFGRSWYKHEEKAKGKEETGPAQVKEKGEVKKVKGR
jgi:mannosyltransferase OCH1-like enzyme